MKTSFPGPERENKREGGSVVCFGSRSEADVARTCRAADYTCAGSAAISSQAYLGCTTTFGQAVAVAGATAISSGSTYAASAATEAAGQGIGANSIAVRFKSGDFIDSTSGGQTSMTVSSYSLNKLGKPT